MRPSLHDIEQTELFLDGKMSVREKQAFAVRMLTEPALHESVHLQQKAYQLIRQHARRQIKLNLSNLFTKLMQEPEFKTALQQIYP